MRRIALQPCVKKWTSAVQGGTSERSERIDFTGIDEGRQDRIFRIYLVFFWTRYDCFERSGLVFWSVFGSVLTGSIGGISERLKEPIESDLYFKFPPLRTCF